MVKWEDLTKDNLPLQWSKWGTFDLPKLVYLHAQWKKADYKITQTEWEAYFHWYLEASKRGNDTMASLQETNQKLLETVVKLEKSSEATFSSSPPSSPPSATF